MKLTEKQLEAIESSLDGSTFLHGPAGTGKTTAGVERLSHLVESGVEGRKILLYFPQRNLGSRYQAILNSLSFQGRSLPVSATYGGIARRMLDLFWPTILENYSFLNTDTPPTFLTLESSLYFLSKVVDPLIVDQGFFSTVTIQRNRLYSQILDNLNKAAIHGFPHKSISKRLLSSWIGDPSQELIYDQAQEAADLFREYCYQHNLLDFSLQIELFTRAQREIPLLRSYLEGQYTHLIYDNVEEDVPVSHDFIELLLPSLSSSLIIFDENAGYRSFLGASPSTARNFESLCQNSCLLQESFTSSDELNQLNNLLSAAIQDKSLKSAPDSFSRLPFFLSYQDYYPQMAEWIAGKVKDLLESGSEAGEIVVLAPFLSDSLRFLIGSSFDTLDIPHTSHRPSRALRDEPVTQCLLTLAALAHPEWDIHPPIYEIALAFLQALNGLDLTRAYLLAKNALRSNFPSSLGLAPFENFPPEIQERISFQIGNKYQILLDWLIDYQQQGPLALDYFQSRLFGELLTQPGFGFYEDIPKGRITAQIIDSYAKFRKTAADVLNHDNLQAGKEYYRMVRTGVLANQYLRSWTAAPPGQVLLAPAYTFLLYNKAVNYQFWLDIGSRGWYERIYQPLTNPHVLHRNWHEGDLWTDVQEQLLNNETLDCLTTGLIRRCRSAIFGCLTETDERGFEQKGLLLQKLSHINALQQISEGSPGDEDA